MGRVKSKHKKRDKRRAAKLYAKKAAAFEAVTHRLIIWRILLVALGGLIVSAIDPFGARTATQQASESAFLSILSIVDRDFSIRSVQTTTQTADGKSTSNMRTDKPIIVILMTLADVDLLDLRAPLLRYSSYCEILETLRAHQPLAIFLDLQFTPRRVDRWSLAAANSEVFSSQERERLDRLDCPPFDGPIGYRKFETWLANYSWSLKADRDLSEAHPPLLYLDFDSVATEDASASTSLSDASRVPLDVLYPPNTYLLRQNVGGVQRPAPAMRLYEIICDSDAASAIEPDYNCRGRAGSRVSRLRHRREMTLQWSHGDPYPEKPPSLYRPDCQYAPQGFGGRFRDGLKRFVLRLLASSESEIGRSTFSQCPNIPYFTLKELIASSDQALNQYIHNSIRDSIVLVGFHYDVQENDRVYTPTHGAVAGVFAHATALDHLIQEGSSVLRPTRKLGLLGEVDVSSLYEMLVVIGTLYLAHLLKRRIKSDDKKYWGKPFKLVGRISLAAVAIFIAVTLALFASYLIPFLRLSPDGWVSTYGVVLVGTVVFLTPNVFLTLAKDSNGNVVPGVSATIAGVLGVREAFDPRLASVLPNKSERPK